MLSGTLALTAWQSWYDTASCDSSTGFDSTTQYDETQDAASVFWNTWFGQSFISYPSTGKRVSPNINLSAITYVQESSIAWTQDTPTGTSLLVEVSYDGGNTWTSVTNGGSLPNTTVGGSDAGISMMTRQTLTASSDLLSSPTISNLIWSINDDNTIIIQNDGDIPCYPEIWITMNSGSDVTIVNTNNNNAKFSFTGLSVNETVYIDNENEYIKSSLEDSNNIYRYNNFNDNFMELIVGTNTLQVTGDCQVQFRYIPRLVTGLS